ncbi:hypothetical protein L1987_07885 [Smallanthus sonchifolius]|uniref:Uncharacterized protein n=1 Tax=Smallanthus sonchifolius TaxID=185202 RepID=A0ACB9JJH7_9ASTR|nr:hypothetical protein L1987_07885 [Smallanthus sonchifolius]
MPTNYYRSSSSSITRIRRSILSMKQDSAAHSIDNYTHQFTSQEHELEAFQKEVTQRFHKLSLVESHELLSVSWISKILDVFLCCQEQFRVVLTNNKSYLSKQPMEKSIFDYFERSVKGLDICNAIRDGIDEMRQWQKQLEIVLYVLGNQSALGESQFRRAKRVLDNLENKIVDEKESSSNLAQRNRSIDQKDLKNQGHRCSKQSRSLSWPASRQLLAMGNNIVVPKGNDIIATNGLVSAIYTMTRVLHFVMWALVVAITCKDHGLQSHFNNTLKNFAWWVPMNSLEERILQEYKKRDKSNSCGLLKEIHMIESFACFMNRFIDSVQFPLTKEHKEEAKKRFEELKIVYESLKNGLDPLERQVRSVFHQIILCRIEGLNSNTRRHN